MDRNSSTICHFSDGNYLLLIHMNFEQKQKASLQHIDENKSFKTNSLGANKNKVRDFHNLENRTTRKIQSLFSIFPTCIRYRKYESEENDATPLLSNLA